jgi:hypothetical protein
MARRVFCQPQERIKGVMSLNTTMTVDALLQYMRLSGRHGIERLDIFRFIYILSSDKTSGIAKAKLCLNRADDCLIKYTLQLMYIVLRFYANT